MSESLGAVSPNPSEDAARPHEEAARDGEAAPSDWCQAWLTLANRILEWHQACEAEDASLIFDNHDQARLA